MRWNPRGFCFIRPLYGGENLFCHASVITDSILLEEGDVVEYDIVYDQRRRKCRADNVTSSRLDDERMGGGDGGGRRRVGHRGGGRYST